MNRSSLHPFRSLLLCAPVLAVLVLPARADVGLGAKIHANQEINQVWGGANSGLDGGNDGGRGITDTPGGLKLQCEGHDVRYRNTWIKELDLKEPSTGFEE